MVNRSGRQRGFAAIEVVLVVVIIALVAGIGVWVYRQKNKTDTAVAPATAATTVTPTATGTTSGVDQDSVSDAQGEETITKKYDSSESSNATSANTAVNNVGDSYNEANF